MTTAEKRHKGWVENDPKILSAGWGQHRKTKRASRRMSGNDPMVERDLGDLGSGLGI